MDVDLISDKKLVKGNGVWALQKDILGLTFNRNPGAKTIQLEKPKRDFLLLTLHKWLRAANCAGVPDPFGEFELVIAKLHHAFIAIPAGIGLLSVCNAILAKKPAMVSIQWNKHLFQTL
jgi:hypothetical protein